MRAVWMASVAAIGICAAVSAAAEDAPAVAARFGALEAVQQISLSPDGTKVAYVTPHPTAGTVVYVADLTGTAPPKLAIASHGKDEQIYWCGWSNAARLVCKVHVVYNNAGQLLGFTRAYALDADGGNAVMLSPNTSRAIGIVQNGGAVIDWDVAGKPGSVLMTRAFVDEDGRDSNVSTAKSGLGVEEVDSLTAKRRTVERPRPDAAEYISDGHGTVRIMGTTSADPDGLLRDKVKYFFRRPASREWEALSSLDVKSTGVGGFNPYAVDAARNVVYGFDDQDGRSALFSVALDGTGTRKLELGRGDVDVDGLVRIGRQGRVVGASYATERRTVEYFDPDLKKLAAGLGRALPGKPLISFVDATAEEGKLLLLATSDTDAGKFYLFDKATRQLGEVLPVRPELTGQAMAPMQAITFPAADGTQIPAYLTLPVGSSGKNIPAVVMPHGGPGARDEWGFDWLVQFFAARGFAVLQPNFRGSTGYGASWYQQNGFKSWKIAIGDVVDAGRWLKSQGIAAPDKLGIVGWSYGGYAALQSSVLDPDLFKGIVAIAPVTDLEQLRSEARDFVNFPLVDAYIGQGPHVKEGSPAQNVARIKAPVLMFHGDRDQNVKITESRLMLGKLQGAGKQVQLVEFPGLKHNLADSAARTRMLLESDQFLRKAMGLPAN